MSNVFPHPATANADRAIAGLEECMPGPTKRFVGPPTILQLKRQAAYLLRAIRKEQKRQEAARFVETLQRRLSDTLAQAPEAIRNENDW